MVTTSSECTSDFVKTLCTHPSVRKISFTGSTAVGKVSCCMCECMYFKMEQMHTHSCGVLCFVLHELVVVQSIHFQYTELLSLCACICYYVPTKSSLLSTTFQFGPLSLLSQLLLCPPRSSCASLPSSDFDAACCRGCEAPVTGDGRECSSYCV